jgi:hypothetical protein
MRVLTKKQRRAIELVKRFALSANECTEMAWRAWLPLKDKSLTEGQIALTRSYADKGVLSDEAMFLLHSDCGITLNQAESAGFSCDDVSGYACLLLGLRVMTYTVTMWKEDIADGLLTKNELEQDGYGDIAASLCKESEGA